MPAYNNALVIKGPAILYGQAVNNQTIFTKGNITIQKRMPMLGVSTDQWGFVDQRLDDVVHEISFTPEGMWDTAMGIFEALENMTPGSKLIEFTSVNLSAAADGTGGTTTLTLASATTVHVGQYITITSHTVAGYIGTWRVTTVTSTTSIKVAMTYTSDGTGTLKVPPCLIIHPLQNWSGNDSILIYQYAGVSKYPSLRLAGSDTCMGEMTVTALYQPYMSGANSVDSLVRFQTYAAPDSTKLDDLDVTDIYTSPPTIKFSTSADTTAPWGDHSLTTLDGVNIEFSMALDADKTDQHGTNNFTIGAIGCVATFTPVGEQFYDAIVQAKLMQMEHSSVEGLRRGQRMGTSSNLEFVAQWYMADGVTPVYFTIPRATLSDASAIYGAAAARNGAVSVTAVRTFSAGSPVALFDVTTD